jgi:hypothetical protein
MIVKEADASESSGSLTKATTGDVTVNSEVFLIREGILTSQTPYLEILDIIEEFLNILIIFEDEKVSELEFIETFNTSKISDVNNLIITLETNFDNFINSNSNLITDDDNVFIENFLEKIRKLYKILNLCTILLTKITHKHELQATNETLQPLVDILNDVEKLTKYINERYNNLGYAITEVEQPLLSSLKLIEPYNTYTIVYGIPEKALFEAERLSIIQTYLDQGLTSQQINDIINV